MLDLGPLVLGTVLTLAAVITALVVSRRTDSEWAPVAVVGGGTVLGLAALALAIAVTTSATDADNDTPPSTDAARAEATPGDTPTAEAAAAEPTSTPTPLDTATATPTSPAPTATPTPTPTAPATPVATEAVAGAPPRRYIATDEGGVRWRSTCASDALLPGWWANGTAVEVIREGPGDCEGWSLVRSRSLVSWVSNESLAGEPPEVATATPTSRATGTPEPISAPATATPTSIAPGQRGSYAEAIDAWIGRLRDIDAALDANFDRAVADSDWVAASRNATRLGTAAVAVRTEVEQTAPFVAELAPDCRDAMAPLGEMAVALVQMASAYQEWLADGLIDNEAGLRVRAEREAMRAAESDAATALEDCG